MRIPLIHLASSSPRRHELLKTLGVTFSAAGVDVDERRLDNEAPDAMVLRLASAKAAAGFTAETQLVLGADTAVVLGDAVYGKPRDRADAINMLASLSGCTHQVMTGVVVHSDTGQQTALSISDVTFREIRPDEARAYWQSGEPWDKAGAYAIQGRGAVFVTAISGSYSGVVGLPVFETAQLLQNAGVDILSGLAE